MPKIETTYSKPHIVWLILNQHTEEALSLLSDEYKVNTPKLKVGLPKGRKKNVLGCYQAKTETISVFNSDIFGNPFVILHEFYHHLRSKAVDKQHRGTEKNADKFAMQFLIEYQTATLGLTP